VKRTEGTVRDNKTNSEFKVSKGAPHVLLKLLDPNDSNSAIVHDAVEKDVHALGMRGIRCLAVCRTDSTTGKWYMLGLLTFLDPPRPDTKQV
jgi:H+-transporting ATPase